MRLIISILSLLILFTGILSAQVQFTADAPRVVNTGEQFRLTFTLNARPSSFNAPDIKDFYVLSGPNQSTSTSFQIINGKSSQSITITYTYYLQATTPGNYTIEPAKVTVDKKEYTSNTVSIEVIGEKQPSPGGAKQETPATQESDQQVPDKELFVRVTTDKKSVYQGEHIIATIKIYTRLQITGFGNSEMPDFAGFWTQDIETPTQINLQRENVGGTIYNTGVIRKLILFPQKAGEITIDPFKLETYIRQRVTTSRSIFDDFFGPSYNNVAVPLESQPVKIKVDPLPANQPVSFTGAVGSMKIDALLDKSEAETNDAITLKIKVSGNGNLKLVDPPKIDFPPDFETYDPKISTSVTNGANGQTGSKTFEYLIIPRHAGNFRIPPISFTYFDIPKKNYETLQTNEFKLNIQKGDEEETVGVVSGLSKEDLNILGSDILFIKSGRFKLHPAGKILFGSVPFYLSYIGSFILFIGIVLFRRNHLRRRQNIELVKNRQANKVARKHLRQASQFLKQNQGEEFYESVSKACWGYLSDKLNIPLSDLSKETAGQSLANYIEDEELINKFIQVIDECELARYSPSLNTGKMDVLYNEAVSVISKIEQKIRG